MPADAQAVAVSTMVREGYFGEEKFLKVDLNRGGLLVELQRRTPVLLFLWMLVFPVQANEVSDAPRSEASGSPIVSDLSVDQFSEVVKAIVQQTLEECAVEGDMEGKAKLNLDVTGDVTARIVCKAKKETEQ